MIPLPDPTAPPNSVTHPNSYEEYPAGSVVMGLYPDTSCFYRAEVVAAPGTRVRKILLFTGSGLIFILSQSSSASSKTSMYRLKFEDDDDQVRTVAAHLVVEWPGPV